MRVLVLGGTVFCSRAIAAAARRRGHDVVCAARGASGTPPDGAALVTIDRNVPGSLEPLRGDRRPGPGEVDHALRRGGTGGTFDGTAPATGLAKVLDEVAGAGGAPDLEVVGLPAETLAEAGVGVWAGPRSLPLWLPESHWGIADRDVTATLAAGFTARSVADTARAALEWEKTLGLDRDRRAGLTPEEEASLLASA